MTILTEEQIEQLRAEGPPRGFKACPHWDDRYRWFKWRGEWWILFCCDRPDLDGSSGPLGDLPRGEACQVFPSYSPEGWRQLARDRPAIGSFCPQTERSFVFRVAFDKSAKEECWAEANRWVDGQEDKD